MRHETHLETAALLLPHPVGRHDLFHETFHHCRWQVGAGHEDRHTRHDGLEVTRLLYQGDHGLTEVLHRNTVSTGHGNKCMSSTQKYKVSTGHGNIGLYLLHRNTVSVSHSNASLCLHESECRGATYNNNHYGQ